jgi:putative hydrolases of HD superfamily
MPSREDDLIKYAKLWASHTEISQNAIIYPEAYKGLLFSLIGQENREEYHDFSRCLPLSKQSRIKEYLLVIHRLASSFRWNQSVRKYPVSVLSHTYIITFFSYILAIESSKTKDEETDILITALFHDIPEAITGDIITPTKKSLPGLEEAIERAEKVMLDRYLLAPISDLSFAKVYERKMLHPWKEPNGSLVKKADIYSALYEAKLELTETSYFEDAYQDMKRRLKTY